VPGVADRRLAAITRLIESRVRQPDQYRAWQPRNNVGLHLNDPTKTVAAARSVQAPELPFDRRDKPAEALRGQIGGEGLELPAGSSPRWERMAYDEPW
jgi:hypothetical protein